MLKRIKHIIFFSLFLLFSQTGFTQNVKLIPTTLDDYVGTWKYENTLTKELFIVKLKKVIDPATPLFPEGECIVGTYCYTKNGEVIVDNTNTFNVERPDISDWPIYASCAEKYRADMYYLFMFFTDDFLKKRSYSCRLKVNSLSKIPQIRWILKEDEGLIAEGMEGYGDPRGFSVPKDVMLTKVEFETGSFIKHKNKPS